MSTILACAFKSTLIFAAAICFARLFHRSSASFRHRIWALAILCALLLPILQSVALYMPANQAVGSSSLLTAALPRSVTRLAHGFSSITVTAVMASPWQNQLARPLVFVWALGCILSLLRVAAGLANLFSISARSRAAGASFSSAFRDCRTRIGLNRPVRLLIANTPLGMPCTWGFVKPAILLPASSAEWSMERLSVVITHELAHIQRFDWPLGLLAEAVRALYWFHPLAWVAVRCLRSESEMACDDAVLRAGENPAGYAQELVELIGKYQDYRYTLSTALAVAHPSNLERRITAMLNPSLNRLRLTRRASLFTTAAAALCLIPLAALRLPAQSNSGHFTGTVSDPRGSAVASATVIVNERRTHTRNMTSTDTAGTFNFEALPAGDYEIRVLKPGFREHISAVQSPIQNISLEMGSVTEQVQVTPSDAPASRGLPSTAPSRLTVGSSVQAAALLRKVQPAYPLSAKNARIQGAVVLEATIGKDGVPTALQVMNGQIDPDLARAAVEAVSQWRYQPTLLNGEPIEVQTNVTVNFTLSE